MTQHQRRKKVLRKLKTAHLLKELTQKSTKSQYAKRFMDVVKDVTHSELTAQTPIPPVLGKIIE
jgi:hypothetical protein